MLRPSVLSLCLLSWCSAAAAQTTVSVNVHAAYLHVDRSDVADPAVPIALSSLGLLPGYVILLQPAGDWDPGPGGDTQTNLLAVFSSNGTLLGPEAPDRVPGALAAGLSNFSGGTFPNNEPTDITEDFLVDAPGVTVQIPTGATHLFVTPADIYYVDNSDPDGDLGVTITVISTASVPSDARSAGLRMAASPNPFRIETAIAFQLEHASTVRLTVHDIRGRLVRTLIDGESPAGAQRVIWDGRDEAGRGAAAGIYFARLEVEGRIAVTRLVANP